MCDPSQELARRRPAATRAALGPVLVLALVLGGCGLGPPAGPTPPGPPDPAPTDPTDPGPPGGSLGDAELRLLVDGLSQPVALVSAGDGSGRLFVVERGGLVRLVDGGALAEAPFLDLTSVLGTVTGEGGLLGLAFHPGFPTDRRIFVHYVTPGARQNTLASLEVPGPDADTVPADTLEIVFETPSVGTMHYAGDLAFGPDGHLYASIGDGGAPDGARDPDTFAGTLIRIAVDDTGAAPYRVPDDNPFLGTDGLDEVWAYGLRNPWRFSFDPATGDLWVADVGQAQVEEVNRQRPADGGGHDYGWNRMEGDRCFPPGTTCDPTGITLPLLVYEHEPDRRASVTGGYVYRGDAFPASLGTYVFGDFVRGDVLVAEEEDGAWTMRTLLETDLAIVAFGTDDWGELYVVDFGGAVHAIVPADDD